MYNLDFPKIISELFPVKIGVQRNVQFVRCMLHPLKQLWDGFLLWRQAKLFDLKYTAQKKSMEGWLNVLYDSDQNRIYIENTDRTPLVYFTEDLDAPQFYFFDDLDERNQHFFDDASFNNPPIDQDFIVHVPNDVTATDDEVRAIVAKRVFSPKTFIIQRF